jgi:hypothetical protein
MSGNTSERTAVVTASGRMAPQTLRVKRPPVHRLLNPSRICTEIVSALDAPELIFAATETAIAVSSNGGASFVDRKPWVNSHGSAWHVSVASLDGTIRRIYALGSGQMWVSLDGGSTWARDLGPVPFVVGGPPDGGASGDPPADFAAKPSRIPSRRPTRFQSSSRHRPPPIATGQRPEGRIGIASRCCRAPSTPLVHAIPAPAC